MLFNSAAPVAASGCLIYLQLVPVTGVCGIVLFIVTHPALREQILCPECVAVVLVRTQLTSTERALLPPSYHSAPR